MYYTPPLFPLGKVVATSTVAGLVPQAHLMQCLRRHMMGDWGCVCEEDAKTNDEAVQAGFRILSAYAIDETRPCKGFGENTLWIITEADRSVTTFLFPDEY
ncbi:type I restriction endonuclease subunit M [Nitrosospira multiformis]|uniref:Type I restriction endonuclease subunit M n=1 Tax=Nitrosospira multiformis TaxID=1231 RepID=A0A1I7J0E1_9PROT|nr:type I restriction endonuclease subunit M [Nitrosospira multiformis]SFU78640.1 hypothetical protein SAMN05216417_1371 [Nitrosospira multiformis]